jgi:hypothetical protein
MRNPVIMESMIHMTADRILSRALPASIRKVTWESRAW